MSLIGNSSRLFRRNMAETGMGIKLILLIILVLSATALGLSQQDVESFQPLWVSGYGGGSVDYSPDGRRIAVGGSSFVVILNAESYEIERQLFNYPSGSSVKWSPDGRYIASGSLEGIITVWEAETGDLIRTFQGERTRRINSVSWSPDSRYLASAGYDFVVDVWDVETGNLITTISIGAPLNAVAWSPNGNYLASGSADNMARIWEAQTGNLVRELPGHTSGVTSVAWSPDNRYLASSGADFDGTIKIWEAETGNLLWTRTHRGGQYAQSYGIRMVIAWRLKGDSSRYGKWKPVIWSEH